jgi:hypothetical protein
MEGLAVRVAEFPAHTAGGEVTETVGTGLTVINLVAVAVHPDKVYVTV